MSEIRAVHFIEAYDDGSIMLDFEYHDVALAGFVRTLSADAIAQLRLILQRPTWSVGLGPQTGTHAQMVEAQRLCDAD